MEIRRKEIDIARRASDRLLIHGRRKVGKTYLSRNFLEYDIYVFVKRGGGFFIEGDEKKNIESYDNFMDLLDLWVELDKKIIIDEFQRLPDEFLDRIHMLGDRTRMILTGSSFHTTKKVISPGSPILGLFSNIKLSLFDPSDIFKGLKADLDPVKAYSLSPFLRDPWTLQYYRKEETDLADIVLLSREVLSSLIGEVFLEEEKTLSRTYEGIIRGLSLGKWKLSLIADLLHSRKLLDKNDPHLVRPYFNTMMDMDLVQKVPVFKRKEFMYRVRSPIMELGFMIDERHNLFQQDVGRKILDDELSNQVPIHIERFTGELLAELMGGKYNYFYSKDFDIDLIITRGKKTLAVGEVKWKGNVKKKDVDIFRERTEHFQCKKYLFSKRPFDDDEIISITPENILDMKMS